MLPLMASWLAVACFVLGGLNSSHASSAIKPNRISKNVVPRATVNTDNSLLQSKGDNGNGVRTSQERPCSSNRPNHYIRPPPRSLDGVHDICLPSGPQRDHPRIGYGRLVLLQCASPGSSRNTAANTHPRARHR